MTYYQISSQHLSYFQRSYHLDIWQVSLQHSCIAVCEISRWCMYCNIKFRWTWIFMILSHEPRVTFVKPALKQTDLTPHLGLCLQRRIVTHDSKSLNFWQHLSYVQWLYHLNTWQASPQHSCLAACQTSRWYNHFNIYFVDHQISWLWVMSYESHL